MILKMATKKHKLLRPSPANGKKYWLCVLREKFGLSEQSEMFFWDPVSSGHNSLRHFGTASPFACDVRISILMMKPPQAAKPGDPHICEGYIMQKLKIPSPSLSLQWPVEVWSCVWTRVSLRTVHVCTWQSSLFIKLSPSVLYQAGVDHSLLAALASFTKDKHKLSSSFEDANN